MSNASEGDNTNGVQNPTQVAPAVEVNKAVPAVATDNSALLPTKFNGNVKEFKTWQQKMLFFLTNLNFAKYLKEDKPVIPEGATDVYTISTVDAWVHTDFLCRGWILNGLIDTLYAVYNNDKEYKTSKDLWNALERKYKSTDSGVQKYAAAKFLDFKMVDSKPIMAQVEQYQLICLEIAAEGMQICEPFTVNCLIEKLPPSWVDFKNYLKHKRKPMTLENLISRLQVEARNRQSAVVALQEQEGYTAYMAEKKKGKGKAAEKKNKMKPSGSTSFKKTSGNNNNAGKKFRGKCNNCGKVGHKAEDCRSKPRGSQSQANLTAEDLCCVVTEVNAVEDNPLEWWYDTGATTHICIDKDMFTTYQKCKEDAMVKMANTGSSKIEGRGKVILQMTSGQELTLNNVKHVPDMRKNLISGTLLSKAGFAVNFEADKLVLRKNGVYLGRGYVKDGLVKMNVRTVKPKKVVTNVSMNKTNPVAYLVESFNIWHERLGHVNYKSVNRLMGLNLIPTFKTNKDKCEICVEAKLTKRPSPQVERTKEPLGLIHTDLCDLKYMPTRGGKKYFVTFIDDCTKYCYIYLLQQKSETLEKFKEFKLEVENQLGKTIKVVRSDRGGEYEGPFDTFCKENGIIHQTTAPYSPESNGVAERKNRTLKEMMNAIMREAGVTQNLWGEALITANYILNKIPHKVTGKTPYELWKGRVPSYKYLKVWGCLAKVSIPPPKQVTVGPKTVDCIFIGYAHNSSAYRFLVHKSDIPDIHVNTIMESRNASFFENIFPCKEKQNLKRPREINDEDTSQNETRDFNVSVNDASTSRTLLEDADEDEPRRSKRARKEKPTVMSL